MGGFWGLSIIGTGMTVKAPFVPEPSPPPSGIRKCPVRLHPNRAFFIPRKTQQNLPG